MARRVPMSKLARASITRHEIRSLIRTSYPAPAKSPSERSFRHIARARTWRRRGFSEPEVAPLEQASLVRRERNDERHRERPVEGSSRPPIEQLRLHLEREALEAK